MFNLCLIDPRIAVEGICFNIATRHATSWLETLLLACMFQSAFHENKDSVFFYQASIIRSLLLWHERHLLNRLKYSYVGEFWPFLSMNQI